MNKRVRCFLYGLCHHSEDMAIGRRRRPILHGVGITNFASLGCHALVRNAAWEYIWKEELMDIDELRVLRFCLFSRDGSRDGAISEYLCEFARAQWRMPVGRLERLGFGCLYRARARWSNWPLLIMDLKCSFSLQPPYLPYLRAVYCQMLVLVCLPCPVLSSLGLVIAYIEQILSGWH